MLGAMSSDARSIVTRSVHCSRQRCQQVHQAMAAHGLSRGKPSRLAWFEEGDHARNGSPDGSATAGGWSSSRRAPPGEGTLGAVGGAAEHRAVGGLEPEYIDPSRQVEPLVEAGQLDALPAHLDLKPTERFTSAARPRPSSPAGTSCSKTSSAAARSCLPGAAHLASPGDDSGVSAPRARCRCAPPPRRRAAADRG